MKKMYYILREYFDCHDNQAHILMGLALTLIAGPALAWAFMIGVEAAQMDMFGIRGRVRDTVMDLIDDGIGVTLASIVLKFFQ